MNALTTPAAAVRGVTAALTLALFLAGCAPVEETIGQCEPGVEGISAAATVTPPGC